ncbi:MAG: hypothetical protein ABIW76_08060 [Fibrobacteria bacterium]
MNRAALFFVLMTMASSVFAAEPASVKSASTVAGAGADTGKVGVRKTAVASGIIVEEVQPATMPAKAPATAVRKVKNDSLIARNKAIKDSTDARHKALADSLALSKKAKKDSAARAQAAKDSAAAIRKSVRADSLKAALAAKALRDSVIAAQKAAEADSLKAAAKAAAMAKKSAELAANLRAKFVRDSTREAKHVKDSTAAAYAKAVRDSTVAAAKAKAETDKAEAIAKAEAMKAAAIAKSDSLKAVKAHNDSLAVARKAARADSLKAVAFAKRLADSIAVAHAKFVRDSTAARKKFTKDSISAVKKSQDSATAALKASLKAVREAAHADSLKAAALRPPPPNMDSASAKRFRVMNRPHNKDQIKYFLGQFGMKEAAKPDSTAVNWIYRDKKGGILTYETGYSDLTYSNESVGMLTEKDLVPDSLIHTRTDAMLKKILTEKADRYTFANYEITLFQKKEGEGIGKVYPAVPAFYTGRYVSKLEDRIVLGDAFQIRLAYGEDGTLQFFSLRDPVVAEAGSSRVPTKEFILDSLARWAKSRTRPQRITYPFHPDKLRVRTLKPLRAFESYVLTQEKHRDNPQQDGTYLVPTVTVLAEATLAPSGRRLAEPAPEGAVILHFNFPCRPETGLCWPDGKQEMHGPVPGMNPAPPGRSAVSPAQNSGKPEIPVPNTSPDGPAMTAPASAPAPKN